MLSLQATFRCRNVLIKVNLWRGQGAYTRIQIVTKWIIGSVSCIRQKSEYLFRFEVQSCFLYSVTTRNKLVPHSH